MAKDTLGAAQPVVTDDLTEARSAAWEEHLRRCEDNDPYTEGVTADQLAERIAQLRQEASEGTSPLG